MYRKDIDGLRGVAVLSVIFFHADFEFLKGGFIGVDIFFVISGFLITKIIMDDLNLGEFRLLSFFERRARRLLPALYTVIFFSTVTSYFTLLPDELENYGQSLVATIFFANNILQLLTNDYWQIESHFKPLLHTWSLGVEEQFYIIFPLLLLLFYKINKIALMVTTLFVLSIIISIYGSMEFRGINFYLTISRAWEILAGSMAALMAGNIKIIKNDFLSMFGLVLIVISILIFDSNYLHPGLITLIPVVGTILIILHGSEASISGKILSNKFIVFFGLISYSLYLWHQPVFSLVRSLSIDRPSLFITWVMLIFIVFVSYFSWRFIENPVRSKYANNSIRFFALIGAASLVYVAIGMYFHYKKGFAEKFYGLEMYGATNIWQDYNENAHKKFIKTGDLGYQNLLIIGSSYGRDFSNALGEVGLLDNVGFNYVSSSVKGYSNCEIAAFKRFNDMPNEIKKSDIVLIGFDALDDCGMAAFENLSNFKKTYWVNRKHFGYNINWVVHSRFFAPEDLSHCGKRMVSEIAINENISQKINSDHLIDLQGLLNCNNSKFYVTLLDGGKLLSVDRTHLTKYGAIYLGAKFKESSHPLVHLLLEEKRQ